MRFDELARDLAAESLGVIVLDTCALLDVIRSSYRQTSRLIEITLELGRLAAAGNLDVNLVLPSVFRHEWDDHVASVSAELEEYLKDFEAKAKYIGTMHASLFGTKLDIPELNQFKYAQTLANECETLLSNCRNINEEEDIVIRAFRRSTKPVAPARKGKSESKDCLVFEETLELGRALRNNGFTAPMVFVTSNVKDYGTVRAPFQAIADDLLSR